MVQNALHRFEQLHVGVSPTYDTFEDLYLKEPLHLEGPAGTASNT